MKKSYCKPDLTIKSFYVSNLTMYDYFADENAKPSSSNKLAV